MADNLRAEIITSKAAERMIDRTTPIYDNSVIGLYIFEAIGREYDTMVQIVDELPDQMHPDTATWLLPLWERRYGLTTDESLPIEERRRRIRIAKNHTGAINPYKVKELAANLTGLEAQVNEFVGPYTCEVVLPYISDGDAAFRKKIRQVKQSHITYKINYELSATFDLYQGATAMSSAHIGLLLPNGDTQAEDDLGNSVLFPANSGQVGLAPYYPDPQSTVELASAEMLSSNISAVTLAVQ